MRVESIREVEAKLNSIVGGLSEEGSVVITKNGRPCAVLMPVTQDTDLEILALSQSKRFWEVYDQAQRRGDRDGWVSLDDAGDGKPHRKRRTASVAAGRPRGSLGRRASRNP